MGGRDRRPYCPVCGSTNIEDISYVNGFIVMDENEFNTLDRMTNVRCEDCGWEGTRYDCKEEDPMLSDEFFERNEFESVINFGEQAWRLRISEDMSFLMTFNDYDNTWTYSDNRNRLYGLKTKDELYTLLKFLNIAI